MNDPRCSKCGAPMICGDHPNPTWTCSADPHHPMRSVFDPSLPPVCVPFTFDGGKGHGCVTVDAGPDAEILPRRRRRKGADR
jgi:hypothetical protein